MIVLTRTASARWMTSALLALVLGLGAPMVGVVAPFLDSPALAAGGAKSADPGENGDAQGAHHAGGPWDDDNHNGVPNFLDGADSHYANSWGHAPYLQWIWHALNLALLIGLIVWFGRKGVMAALRDRSLGIRVQLEESAGVHDAAQARYRELEQRLSGFEGEVSAMKADAQAAAAAEHAAALTRADEAAARVREAAERAIRDEVHRATRALRAEAVTLAVELAERTLVAEVGDGDRQRLASAFLESIRTDGATHG
jgi:F-type H+-transporting ATPase subunit b